MILADVHTIQLDDPTTGLDGLNCTCTTGAEAVKWRWRNVRPTPDPELLWPPTGGMVRSLCRTPSGAPDTEGGTNLLQVRDAVDKGWGVPLEVLTNADFDTAWDLGMDPDVLLIWQFQYSVLHGTQFEASETFLGAHAACSAHPSALFTDWSDPLADGRRAGIPKGIQRLPRALLREACGQLVVDPGTGQRRGVGRANVAVCRALPEVEQPTDSGDLMFNIGPTSTHRDAVLKAGTVLYRDAALTTRHSKVKNETPLGFLGSTGTAHVVVNGGRSNYVKRVDVDRIVTNDRTFE